MYFPQQQDTSITQSFATRTCPNEEKVTMVNSTSITCIAVISNTTSSIDPNDPYLMSCDQLHQIVLSYQNQTISSWNGATATLNGNMLIYYQQVYNLRIDGNAPYNSWYLQMTPPIPSQYVCPYP